MSAGQWFVRISLGIVLATGIVSCGLPGSSSDRPSPVFLDSSGTCPMQYGNTWPRDVCLHDQYFGNARAGLFSPQKGPWGLAYAYNCWGKKRPFGMRVGLSGADFSWGEIDLAGRTKDRGFVMESGKVGPPVQASITYLYLVQVRTVCTWHIRGVDGKPKFVKSHVPPIPHRKL